jgi:dihydrofolate synthase/folylpolyglutamate synthase
VNGEPISEDAVVDGVEALGTLIARIDATVFEATTALGLDHFARERVDIAVLEVGLGGRVDSTTVGRPAVAALGPIDFDHREFLGDTLTAIATEKAAIFRSGTAVSAAQPAEAEAVVVAHAAKAGVPLLMEGRELSVRVRERSLDRQRIDCAGPGWRLDDLHLPLLGAYQPSNALVAVAAAQVLGVGEPAIRAGIARARWPGRFEVRRRDRGWLVLDGAHNPAGARALAASLATYFPDAPVTLVFGVLRDKDAPGILQPLLARARRVILTAFPSPRAAHPADLRALVPAAREPREAASVAEALTLAGAGETDAVVCVAGSLALIGETLRHLDGDSPCPVDMPRLA